MNTSSNKQEGVNLLRQEPAEIEKQQPAAAATMHTMHAKMEKNHDPEDDPDNAARRPQSRSVTFYPGVSVRECLHINNFTDEELDCAWYKKQDFQRIKAAIAFIVQKIGNGTWQGDTEHETARGLEYRHREGSMKRKSNKLNGLMAVLDEQERQWRRGIDDDGAISDAFIAVNMKCSFAARVLAANDEEEVRDLWADDVDVDVHMVDVHMVSTKISNISVETAKRPFVSPEHDERNKKTRLKQFMKKIQINMASLSKEGPKPSWSAKPNLK